MQTLADVESSSPKVAGGRDRASFVITLWLESRDSPAEPEWRWRVVDVQAGDTKYFHRLSDVQAHVSERAGVSPPS